MKQDITIPQVTDVEIAIVLDKNETDGSDQWGVYILNKKNVALETVIIVSQGFSETKKTSLFRRKIDTLPADSFAKFEVMQPELFVLDNRFQISFFLNNQLHDKTFIFKAGTVQEDYLQYINMLDKQGVVCR